MSNRSKLAYGLPPDITRLLYTNDPRVDDQIQEIKSSLSIAHSLKSSLASQVTEARMTLMRLEREELHASRHMERCEFALAPIRRIPTETLQQIFIAYADLLGDTPDCLDVQGGIWVLSHICSYWRGVAVSTAGLWAALSFQGRFGVLQRGDAPALVGLWLERSKNRPLSIRYEYDYRPRHGTPEQENLTEPVFECLLLRRTRWKEAYIKAPFSLLSQLQSDGFQFDNLEKFHLGIQEHSMRHWQQFTLSQAPLLQHIVLHNSESGPLIHLPWSQIKSYTGPFLLNQRSHIFFEASTLEDCALISIPTPPHLYPPQPVVHHRLRRLRLLEDYSAMIIPESLTLPALQSLRFCAGDALESVPSIQRLLQRSSPPLTVLHIDDFLHPDELIHVLRTVPSVAELTIRTFVPGSTIAETENFFRTFTEDETGLDMDGPILPSLRRLDLKGLPLGEIAVGVLEWRSRPPASSSSVVRLESLTLADVYNTSTEHLVRIMKLPRETGLKLDAGAVCAMRMIPSV
ncbi:hypothetical protein FB45DRAFT_1064400 [Roridomyces roridus]|uniref:F-box domain-containing protein n=1 Tax=Roridomyces roridus TaxID=1738132 RepID=A0AAD7BB66_9AGAR|nr:hypothetical protein FB45DRAFT_1064400 [Roridomyces roridus]